MNLTIFLPNYCHKGIVNYISYSPNGKYIASASDDKTVCFLDMEHGNWHERDHDDVVNTISFSPNGNYAVSASNDYTIRVWDMKTNTLFRKIEGESAASSAFFCPDGRSIVSAHGDGTIRVWDTETGISIQTIEGHNDSIYSCSFNSKGDKIISVSSEKNVSIWDFFPLQQLIDETRERFKNRQLTPEERQKYYLE